MEAQPGVSVNPLVSLRGSLSSSSPIGSSMNSGASPSLVGIDPRCCGVGMDRLPDATLGKWSEAVELVRLVAVLVPLPASLLALPAVSAASGLHSGASPSLVRRADPCCCGMRVDVLPDPILGK